MSRPNPRIPTNIKRPRAGIPRAHTDAITDTVTQSTTTTSSRPAPQQHHTPPAHTYQVVLPSDTTFDLHKYISQYTGTTRLHRLLFIAQHCQQLATAALTLCINEIKAQRTNLTLYNEAITIANTVLPQSTISTNALFRPDSTWADQLTRLSNTQLNRLEQQHTAAKRDGERDVVRTALLGLAEYYAVHGEYNNAVSKYLEARDFTPANDTQQMHIINSVMKCSIDSQTLVHVKHQVQRARTLPNDVTNDPVTSAQLYAAHGLYSLKNESPSQAVDQFIHVTAALGDTYNSVCTLSDVATYVALCGLASYTRKQLKQNILNNVEYQKLLDNVPVWRDILDQYYNNQHSQYTAQLNSMQAELQLDIYVGTHVHRLLNQIRNTAMINYITPYSNVSLRGVTDAFGLSAEQCVNTVEQLIINKQLSARIDSVNSVVHMHTADQRTQTFDATVAAGQRYINDVTCLLVKYSCMEQQISVGDPSKQQKSSFGGGKTRSKQSELRAHD